MATAVSNAVKEDTSHGNVPTQAAAVLLARAAVGVEEIRAAEVDASIAARTATCQEIVPRRDEDKHCSQPIQKMDVINYLHFTWKVVCYCQTLGKIMFVYQIIT